MGQRFEKVTIFLKGLEKIHEGPDPIPDGSQKLGTNTSSTHVN
jgi:hypothetical protein